MIKLVALFSFIYLCFSCSVDYKNKAERNEHLVLAQEATSYDYRKYCETDEDCVVAYQGCCHTQTNPIAVNSDSKIPVESSAEMACLKNKTSCPKTTSFSFQEPYAICVKPANANFGQCQLPAGFTTTPTPPQTPSPEEEAGCYYDSLCTIFYPNCCDKENPLAINRFYLGDKKKAKSKTCETQKCPYKRGQMVYPPEVRCMGLDPKDPEKKGKCTICDKGACEENKTQ